MCETRECLKQESFKQSSSFSLLSLYTRRYLLTAFKSCKAISGSSPSSQSIKLEELSLQLSILSSLSDRSSSENELIACTGQHPISGLNLCLTCRSSYYFPSSSLRSVTSSYPALITHGSTSSSSRSSSSLLLPLVPQWDSSLDAVLTSFRPPCNS